MADKRIILNIIDLFDDFADMTKNRNAVWYEDFKKAIVVQLKDRGWLYRETDDVANSASNPIVAIYPQTKQYIFLDYIPDEFTISTIQDLNTFLNST